MRKTKNNKKSGELKPINNQFKSVGEKIKGIPKNIYSNQSYPVFRGKFSEENDYNERRTRRTKQIFKYRIKEVEFRKEEKYINNYNSQNLGIYIEEYKFVIPRLTSLI